MRFAPPLPTLAVTAIAIVATSACNEAGTVEFPSEGPEFESASFSDLFDLSHEILLEQPGDHVIARISGIAVDSTGLMLLGDASEGNVKMYGGDGRLVNVIGRKGSGPGEFSVPRFPRFTHDGRIVIADAQEPRIQMFDRQGVFEYSIFVPDLGLISGFEPMPDGSYLVAALRSTEEDILVHLDSAGNTIATFLPIRDVRPSGLPDYELWRNFRSFFLSVRHDTAFVTSTLTNTVWSVHVPTGEVQQAALEIPGYVRPHIPASQPADIPALLEWGRSFHQASTITNAGGTMVFPWVQGVLSFGDPLIVVLRDCHGRWKAAADAPPIVGGGGGYAVGLLTPGEETVKVGLYRVAACVS
jgi:hypothetical protein